MLRLDMYDYQIIYAGNGKPIRIYVTVDGDFDPTISDIVTEAVSYGYKLYVDGHYCMINEMNVEMSNGNTDKVTRVRLDVREYKRRGIANG